MALSKLRTFASSFFLSIAVAFTLLYYPPASGLKPGVSSHFLSPEGECLKPTLFLQAPYEVSLSFSSQHFQLFSSSFEKLKLDCYSVEIFTSDAVDIPASIRNVFYLLVSINAP